MAARPKSYKRARVGSPLHKKRISEGVKLAHKRRKTRGLFKALRDNPGALHRELGVPLHKKLPDSLLKKKLSTVKKQKGSKARRTEKRIVAALTAHKITRRRMAKKGVRWTTSGRRK